MNTLNRIQARLETACGDMLEHKMNAQEEEACGESKPTDVKARLMETALNVPNLDAKASYVVSKQSLVYGPFQGRAEATKEAKRQDIDLDYVIDGADLTGIGSYTAKWRSGEIKLAAATAAAGSV